MKLKAASTTQRTLPSLPCPQCGELLHMHQGAIMRPHRWDECLRRCDVCRIGFSNGRDNPTVIHHDPTLNVPPPVREDVVETLSESLNERNRENKRRKFGFSTSEDALTWTVFRYLQDVGQLLGALKRAGLPIPKGATRIEAMLLWGVPIPFDRMSSPRGWALRAQLKAISDRLGEDPRSRTEPDIVIDLGIYGLLIIEVKHRSGTDQKNATYPGWGRYYACGDTKPETAAMITSGCYELARNWRFGIEVAESQRPFTLVCLGPDPLFSGDAGEVLRRFETCLPANGMAGFRRLSWNELLTAIDHPPTWLVDYLRARGYLLEGGCL